MANAVDFGSALQFFREERHLSLRELGKLSDVDHAYIHRLESGDKAAPSGEILDKLSRALKLTSLKRQLLDVVMKSGPIDRALFELALREPQRMGAIQVVATMSFRGARPQSEEEWLTKISQIEALMENDRR
jgi:transcriptional regulator with XRE-family HTH domain